MTLRKTFILAATATLLAAALLAFGCGGDDSATTASNPSVADTADADADADADAASDETSASNGPADATLEVGMDDFSFDPSDATTTAGSVEISAPNVGATTHELVLAKTNLDPAELPTAASGEVDEEALDIPGEIPDVAAGATGTATVDLEAGQYVIFCNLPAHYAQGMYGSLTVKDS